MNDLTGWRLYKIKVQPIGVFRLYIHATDPTRAAISMHNQTVDRWVEIDLEHFHKWKGVLTNVGTRAADPGVEAGSGIPKRSWDYD